MTERRLSVYTFITALFASLLVIMLLASCDPLKRAVKRQESLDKAVADYLRRNPPRTDTLYMPGDTIYHTDTLVYENIYIDTVRINDTVYIVKERLRKIIEKVVIRDTVLHKVNDCQALRDDNMLITDKLNKSKERIKQLSYGILGLLGIMILLLTAAAYNRK